MSEVRIILKCDCCWKEGFEGNKYFGDNWKGGIVGIPGDGYNIPEVFKMAHICPVCRNFLCDTVKKAINDLRERGASR